MKPHARRSTLHSLRQRLEAAPQLMTRPTSCRKCGSLRLEDRNELGLAGLEGLSDGQANESLAGNGTILCSDCGWAAEYFDSSDPSPEQAQMWENIRNGQFGEARFRQWCVKNGFHCFKSTSLPLLGIMVTCRIHGVLDKGSNVISTLVCRLFGF